MWLFQALWTVIRFEKQYHDTKQDTEQMKLKPDDEEKKQSVIRFETPSLIIMQHPARNTQVYNYAKIIEGLPEWSALGLRDCQSV